MVMALAEQEDSDVWNGILFPTDREHHESLSQEFPGLVSHSVLGKWLYLPMNDLNFEDFVGRIGILIARGDARFGVLPSKTRKK